MTQTTLGTIPKHIELVPIGANIMSPNTNTAPDLKINGVQEQVAVTFEYAIGLRQGKGVANQIAELTLAGHIVHPGQDGDFLVCKYGMSRYCRDFAQLQAFARQLGVAHHG